MQLRMNTQLDAKSQDLIQLPATSAANEQSSHLLC